MFEQKSLDKIDGDYFNIIIADSQDVTIQSRNTGHYWYLHCAGYPTEEALIIFHKHRFKDGYHQHGHARSLRQAIKSRESIDHISYLASFEEIEEKDFNLLISSYVVAEDKKKDVDIEKINTRVAELTKKVNMLRLEVDDIVAEIRRAQDE